MLCTSTGLALPPLDAKAVTTSECEDPEADAPRRERRDQDGRKETALRMTLVVADLQEGLPPPGEGLALPPGTQLAPSCEVCPCWVCGNV